MVAASAMPSIIQVAQLSLNITIYDARYTLLHHRDLTATQLCCVVLLPVPVCASCCAYRWVPGSARIAVVGATAGSKGCLQVLQLAGSTLESIADVRKPAPLKCSTFGAVGDVPCSRVLAAGSWGSHS